MFRVEMCSPVHLRVRSESAARNKQRKLFLITSILVMIAVAMTTSIHAKTLSFPAFAIDIPDDWKHSIEDGSGEDRGSIVSLRHPDIAGTLKMQSYGAPIVVSEDVLRNMTNVQSSISLSRENWGDFSGYQYSYSENGKNFRQWWLAKERTIIFITYQYDAGPKDIDTEAIDKIVRSLTVNDS